MCGAALRAGQPHPRQKISGAETFVTGGWVAGQARLSRPPASLGAPPEAAHLLPRCLQPRLTFVLNPAREPSRGGSGLLRVPSSARVHRFGFARPARFSRSRCSTVLFARVSSMS